MQSLAPSTDHHHHLDPGNPPKVLSCSSCRSRKVKCDKVYPCGPCVRGGMECVFPQRKRNRTPRRTKQTDLLDRLARLETIVGKVDPEALSKLDEGKQGPASRPVPAPSNAADHVPPAASSIAQTGQHGGGTFMPGSLYSGMMSTVTTIAATDGPLPASYFNTKQAETDVDPSLSTPGAYDEPTRKYLSQDFWTNLCQSVEGLRVALQYASDSEDEDDEDHDHEPREHTPDSTHHSDSGHNPSPPRRATGSPLSSLTTSHILLGDTSISIPTADALAHPPPQEILYLLSTYFSNVDPLLKILHRPTISTQIATFLSSGQPRASSPGLDALFFAIYFAAATSLPSTPPSNTPSHFPGFDRASLVARFRLATELALARADYLTHLDSLLPLQAFTIYVAILRCHSGSQASWALLSLAVRLAHAHGLHRDGDDGASAVTAHSPSSNPHQNPASNPSPASSCHSHTPSFFEAEMRRRLWWQLLILDVRDVEDRGTASLILPDDFNTALPTNISDDAFGPSSTLEEAAAATAPDDVATDATFLLCTACCSRGMLLVGTPVLSINGRRDERPKEETVRVIVQGLERRFGKMRSGEGSMVSSLAAEVSRVVILKLWLVLRFPWQGREQHPQSSSTTSQQQRAAKLHGPNPIDVQSLRQAVCILEISEMSMRRAAASRYGWYTATYVQWHPLAVTLAELCEQPLGELADRAWAVVMRVYPQSREWVADSKRGALWRPIRKLYKKAKEARERALRQGSEGIAGDRGSTWDGEMVPQGGDEVQRGETALASPAWETGIQIPTCALPVAVDPALTSGGGVSAAMAAEAYPAAVSFLDEVDFNAMDMGQFGGEPMDWTNWNEFVSDAQGSGDNGAAAWMADIG